MNVCQMFPALDPIRLRKQKCSEVLLLLRRMARYQNRNGKDGENSHAQTADDDVIIVRHKNGDVTTMRRAKDDRSW